MGLQRLSLELIHPWVVILMNYQQRPLMFVTSGLYFIVLLKDPGTIPIVKVELPFENNLNRKKYSLLRQMMNLMVKFHWINSKNDNTIQKQNCTGISFVDIIKNNRQTIRTSYQVEECCHRLPLNRLRQILKQTCISISNAAIPPILTTERRFCMKCLNEQPMRAKKLQEMCYIVRSPLSLDQYMLRRKEQAVVSDLFVHPNYLVNNGYLILGSEYWIAGSYGGYCAFADQSFGISSYYVTKNITTWEYLSWKRIAYIAQNSRYPFDKSVINNVRLLLQISCEKQIYDWQIQSQ